MKMQEKRVVKEGVTRGRGGLKRGGEIIFLKGL